MGIQKVVRGGVFTLSLLLSVAAFADTISGTAGAGFQSWTAAKLNQNGKPYWDNTSLDGSNMNIGFFLTGAPTAPLAGAPGALPFWGKAYNSTADSGGAADPNFTFQRTASFSVASLELEVAGNSNINEFGWYNTTDPSTLHPIFLGADAAPASDSFTPSSQYGFYLKGDSGTYYTQSSLNPGGDTAHQHFAVFQESSVAGAEAYWLGVEDLSVSGLYGAEGNLGDYNDMLVRIGGTPPTLVPEPSTVALVASSVLLMTGLLRRRRR